MWKSSSTKSCLLLIEHNIFLVLSKLTEAQTRIRLRNENIQSANESEKVLWWKADIRQPSPRNWTWHLRRGEYIAFQGSWLYQCSPIVRQVIHAATRTSLQRIIGCGNRGGSYVRRATAHGIVLFANLDHSLCRIFHCLFSSFAPG